MTQTQPQSNQVVQTDAEIELGLPAGSTLQAINDAMSQSFRSPCRLFASAVANAILNISASLVQSGNGAAKAPTPINGITPITFPASTVDFQTGATTGGTFNQSFPNLAGFLDNGSPITSPAQWGLGTVGTYVNNGSAVAPSQGWGAGQVGTYVNNGSAISSPTRWGAGTVGTYVNNGSPITPATLWGPGTVGAQTVTANQFVILASQYSALPTAPASGDQIVVTGTTSNNGTYLFSAATPFTDGSINYILVTTSATFVTESGDGSAQFQNGVATVAADEFAVLTSLITALPSAPASGDQVVVTGSASNDGTFAITGSRVFFADSVSYTAIQVSVSLVSAAGDGSAQFQNGVGHLAADEFAILTSQATALPAAPASGDQVIVTGTTSNNGTYAITGSRVFLADSVSYTAIAVSVSLVTEASDGSAQFQNGVAAVAADEFAILTSQAAALPTAIAAGQHVVVTGTVSNNGTLDITGSRTFLADSVSYTAVQCSTSLVSEAGDGSAQFQVSSSGAGYFLRVAFILKANSTMDMIFSAPIELQADLPDPAALYTAPGMPIGWVDVVATGSSAFKTIGSAGDIIENNPGGGASMIYNLAVGGGGSGGGPIGSGWGATSLPATLADNMSSPTTAITIPVGSTNAGEIPYKIVRNGNYRKGRLEYVTDGVSNVQYTDVGPSEIGSTGVVFSVILSGSNILIQYTTTSTGSAATMTYAEIIW